MGQLKIGKWTYSIAGKPKAAVNIWHPLFVHTNEQKQPWKIFKRLSGETDAKLQQRILDKIAELEEVRARDAPTHATCIWLCIALTCMLACALHRSMLLRPMHNKRRRQRAHPVQRVRALLLAAPARRHATSARPARALVAGRRGSALTSLAIGR